MEFSHISPAASHLKILHPLDGELIGNDVDFIHGHDERKFIFVKNGTGIKHVGHEGDRVHRARSVHHVDHDSGQRRGQGFRDDGPG